MIMQLWLLCSQHHKYNEISQAAVGSSWIFLCRLEVSRPAVILCLRVIFFPVCIKAVKCTAAPTPMRATRHRWFFFHFSSLTVINIKQSDKISSPANWSEILCTHCGWPESGLTHDPWFLTKCVTVTSVGQDMLLPKSGTKHCIYLLGFIPVDTTAWLITN